MNEELDIFKTAVIDFVERIAKIRDDCVIEAMAAGIDLHEMGIQEWMTHENGKIQYLCKAVKIKE